MNEREQWAEAAERIRAQMTANHAGNWGMDLNQWDWVPGVGLIALLEYGLEARHTDTLEQLKRWMERNWAKSAEAAVINAVAPCAIFPELYRQTGDERYRAETERMAAWLVGTAPRTREDAFEHTVTENVAFAEQVWADTVFMAVLFLARAAALLGRTDYAAEAQRQTLLHLRLLADEENGVLYHGWNCVAGNHMSAVRWARANAWIAVAVPMIVQETQALVPVPQELKERYIRLMDGLLCYQQEDGLWSTVLDRPDFYRETSGSAGIGCGLLKALEADLLPDEARCRLAAERALAAVLAQVGPDGSVGGVSGGTPVMEDEEAYGRIPVYPTLYGQGLALMLLAQRLKGAIADE
ncbi:glycoside hydrolase family 88 protein [Cohnella fermenti]|uniref:Glycosyl hydrolase n=1 Tax=Cohnella fermenti TaxID=2565925 RepID=A0A4S4BIE4_9BACL|nr:glycoside hydrolase family 88 protein [Cohnella fermenti]THF74150.1 glycosyl hydrolase [Cohnella fermenti]